MIKLMEIKNKKGQTENAVIWLYRFFILVVVIGGTIGIVAMHYSKQVDVRNVESAIVAKKIVDCIAPDGIVQEFGKDMLKECIPLDEQEIYLNLTLGNDNFDFGDRLLATLCGAKEKGSVKYPPSCLEQRYYLVQNNENKHLSLFLAIKKIEKNL
ncbi:MAG: hypothetical protein K6T16_00505 [Candidatus Pacearchaeota archaeon]|nr:hypothetical protein [Candidatus Pacearchaeota archaeon]